MAKIRIFNKNGFEIQTKLKKWLKSKYNGKIGKTVKFSQNAGQIFGENGKRAKIEIPCEK